MKPKKNNRAVRAAERTTGAAVGVIGAIFKTLLTVFLICMTTGLLFACIFAVYVKTCLSSDMGITLSDYKLNLSSKILYQNEDGNWQELITLKSNINREWVDYSEIPEYMVHAAVAIEDQRFYRHKGVDWYRTAGAFVNMFLGMKNEFGGSTITQQLIKNITREDDITVQRKLLEIFQALELEKNYSKEDILEWYLNAIYFGERCYGVKTAAKTYFNKSLSELSLAECASIVGITNNPSKYDPFISVAQNQKRQQTILWEMYDQGYITYDEYTQAKDEELVFVRSEGEAYVEEVYTYYEEAVINDVLEDLMERKGVNLDTAKNMLYNSGYQIYCCLDPRLQSFVDSVYTNLDQLPKTYYSNTPQQLQSAIVIMDPYTGKIVALSGGTGVKDRSRGLNRIDSQRPPGSSIKPLSVYGPALEYGMITQNTLVNDSPDIKLQGTTWYPRNAGGGNRNITTIRQALTSSLNTVAAQILDKLTPASSYDYLVNRLKITSLIEADCDYAPLALGQLTNGITVREMAQSYSSFVNDGVLTMSRTYEYVTEADGVTVILDNPPETSVAWSANTARNIINMLQNAVNYGTGTEANLGTLMPVAGKTGTTSDDWDRWFVGMTPYYVAAVWTGYDTNARMYFYGNPAAQIWKKVMSQVVDGLAYKEFPYPTYIGGDTMIFGDLTEEKEEQDNPSPSPSDSPAPSPGVTPGHTEPPAVTEPVTPTEPVQPSDTILG